MTSGEAALALDIGGTSLKLGVVRNVGSNLVIEEEATVRHDANNVDALRRSVVEVVRRHVAKFPIIDSVGISTTGSVSSKGVVIAGPFFEGYVNFDWSAELHSSVSKALSVSVLNDGQAAALGTSVIEFNHRQGPIALFVVGTGIGGGLVIEGRLQRGFAGFAGSFGHVKVCAADESVCICTRTGCVENIASGRAIARAFVGHDVSLEDVGATVDRVHSALVVGDPRAAEVFEIAGSSLGRAIGDVANVLNPEVVVIGGGVVRAASDNAGTNVYVERARAMALATCTPRVSSSLSVEVSNERNPALFGAAVQALGVGRSD